MTRGIPSDYQPDNLEVVPTLAELAQQGMASVVRRTSNGEPAVFTLTEEGSAYLGAIMRRNADRTRAHLRRRDEQGSSHANKS